jgi:predicted signal transduction protein with EAL and GGDEF domain
MAYYCPCQMWEAEALLATESYDLVLTDLRRANIVAEGIETAGQLEFVRSLGVPYAQGFYFYRPSNFQELEKRLSSPENEALGPLIPTGECCHANISH